MSNETPQAGERIRKPIGIGTAWIEIEIDTEGETANLIALNLGGETSIEPPQIVQALQDIFHLKADFNLNQISECLSRAAATPHQVLRDTYPIAQSVPPQRGSDGRLSFPSLNRVNASTDLNFAELKTAFEQTEISDVLQSDLNTLLVSPQEILATQIPPETGPQGQNILGHAKPGLLGKPAHLKAGSNVTESDGIFLSDIYGYVCLINDEISVINPIWISPDFVSAYFIYFPQPDTSRLPATPWIRTNLEHKNITVGIDQTHLEALWRKVADQQKKEAFLIAQGALPVHGKDAKIQFLIDYEKRPGQLLNDGSIDFHERNSVVAVEKDQQLAEITPATKGKDGVDLSGRRLVGKDGKETALNPGENVRIAFKNTRPYQYFAQIAGNAKVSGKAISVREILKIYGDLDYNLGNVEAGKDVVITGSVRSSFQVKAGGDILIGGVAEQGANISASGDILVTRGIVGETTKIMALGDIETKFIQNSTVMAKRHVHVGSYIFNATVRAGSDLTVYTKGTNNNRAGTIAGGSAVAGNQIQFRIAGAPMADRTHIGIVTDIELEARLDKLKRGIDFCNAEILRIFRTLKIKDLSTTQIQHLAQRTPTNRKPHVTQVLKKLQKLITMRDQGFKQQNALEKERENQLKEAQITITGRIIPDVQISIGEHSTTIDTERTGSKFHLEEDEIVG